MMQGYEIEMQEQGEELVACKQIKMGVSTDKQTGQKKGMFPLKSINGDPLPCLKVRLSNGDADHRFELRWSNYYETMGSECPGKFKLVRVDLTKPLMLYVTDQGNGRKLMHKNRPVIDHVAMAMRFGSHYDHETLSWTWGDNQPFEQGTEEMWESSNLDTVIAEMTSRFGEELAEEAILAVCNHALFQEFLMPMAA